MITGYAVYSSLCPAMSCGGLNHCVLTVCADACATFSQERHDNSLRCINGFCRQRTVQQLADELAQAKM